MKKLLLLTCSLILAITSVFSQYADPDIFTLNLGNTKCLFKYYERASSMQVFIDSPKIKNEKVEKMMLFNGKTLQAYWAKDSPITIRALKLVDTAIHSIHIRKPAPEDTFLFINEVTMMEMISLPDKPEQLYRVKAEMTYAELIKLIKSQFELKGPTKTYKVSTSLIYYETAEKNRIVLTSKSEEALKELTPLKEGGFALIYLDTVENDQIQIENTELFVALINITK